MKARSSVEVDVDGHHHLPEDLAASRVAVSDALQGFA